MYNLAIRKCTSPAHLAPRLEIFKLKFTTPPGIEPRTCWTRGRHATNWVSADVCVCVCVYNRKRSIFCGSLEKELRKRLVKWFVWSVVLYGAETWTLRRDEEKRLEAFEMWVWRRMERVKWTDKIKNAVVPERVGRRKNNAGTDKEEEKKWAGTQAKK